MIGAGISGLAAATFLDGEGLDLTVLESASTPGGNVRTLREDGRVIDHAANGWLDNEPAMGRLLERVGLVESTIPASDGYGIRWIFADGRMHPAPMGPGPMVLTALVSPQAKLRLLAEPFLPRGGDARVGDEEDRESVGEFVARRLGPAFVERMVGPMVAGIYAADPYQLSLRAAFPRMYELEREYRSLFLAMLRLRRGGAPSGHLHTLPGGAGALTDTLVERLGPRVRCGQTVTTLEQRGDGWRVGTAEGALDADVVLLACPGHVQAELLSPMDDEAAAALRDIPYSPVAVVVTASAPGSWEREPDGFGVLAARDADLGGVLGTVFTSCIFPDQAPEGEVLLRTIVGGGIVPEAAGLPDGEMIARVRAAHEAFFGAECAEPRRVWIFRHPRGIPAYRPGHLQRVAAVLGAEQRRPGLFCTGNHLQGIGVKDCARQGEAVAARIRTYFG
ncbi:MAG: protoporphyrinogen oxidase [Deltaproteobacteria bacterium]|nr:protoporphyrinogen oxidase [Deltaproteobacteria bacterium]